MLASVAASNWDAITDELAQVKRRSELGPRVVLAEQLKRFLAFPVVQRVGLSLRSAVNEALNQLESPDDSGLHLFEPNDPSLAVLRTLRFAEDDIDFMTRLVTNQVFGGGF